MLMNAEIQIQFLNHACVKIITDTVTVVSDPWFSGAIFNKGWQLIWTSDELFPLAADSDYVWLSHEHPDHFSPDFFRRLDGKKPEVLFQATRDRRLARYLAGRGFNVHEIPNGGRFALSPVEQLTIGKSGLWDSWNLFESADKKILNINDCILKTDGDLRAIKKRIGPVDVLLTQFSYAGWVGERSDKRLREDAARRRLDVVRRQIEHLEPRYVIPFASFARFSHEENSYLNDSVNRISDFLDVCSGTDSTPIVMKPTDTWRVGEARDNTPAIQFWEREFDAVPSMALQRMTTPVDFATLASQCAAYQAGIFKKNSNAWIKLLSAVPFLHLFHPVDIRLVDLGTTVRFSFFDELRQVDGTRSADIEMASDSLSFLFANEFGLDTLLVSARCNGDKKGIGLTMRNFGIGVLNSMGWSVGLGMFGMVVREFRLIWLVLRELKHVNPD
jgi:UDP-MurNAc hydroxylase